MSEVLISIAVIVTLSIVGGVFAAAETSLVALRESQIQRLAAVKGRRGARLARLAASPNRFLGAVQVGVTLAGFLSAGYGSSQIAPYVSPLLQSLGLSEPVSDTIAFVLITFLVAYISLVLGELVPKRIALQRVEATALRLSGVVDMLAHLSRPFIWLVSASTNGIVRLIGLDPDAGRSGVSEDELRRMVASHASLSETERAVIDDVFDAADRELVEVMVPRTEVRFLRASMTAFTAAKEVMGLPYSRYPVIRGSADDVIGFVHLRDVVNPAAIDRAIRLGAVVREIPRFPESKHVLPTLRELQSRHQHLALVVDEYGGTAGIVTLEDLVEELVGDIRDEYDDQTPPERDRGPGIARSQTVDGLTNLEDFADISGVYLPEGHYETVAGFLMAQLGRLAIVGDYVDVGSNRLTVTELDGRRVSRLSVSPTPPADAPVSPPATPE